MTRPFVGACLQAINVVPPRIFQIACKQAPTKYTFLP